MAAATGAHQPVERLLRAVAVVVWKQHATTPAVELNMISSATLCKLRSLRGSTVTSAALHEYILVTTNEIIETESHISVNRNLPPFGSREFCLRIESDGCTPVVDTGPSSSAESEGSSPIAKRIVEMASITAWTGIIGAEIIGVFLVVSDDAEESVMGLALECSGTSPVFCIPNEHGRTGIESQLNSQWFPTAIRLKPVS